MECPECGKTSFKCPDCGNTITICEFWDIFHIGHCSSCGRAHDEPCETRVAADDADREMLGDDAAFFDGDIGCK